MEPSLDEATSVFLDAELQRADPEDFDAHLNGFTQLEGPDVIIGGTTVPPVVQRYLTSLQPRWRLAAWQEANNFEPTIENPASNRWLDAPDDPETGDGAG